MIEEFEFPDTGEGIQEGKFLEWNIEEGDTIEEDQVLAEAETDKAVVEIPAPSDGKVIELLVEPGDKVEVGQVIMKMEKDEGEVSQKTDENETKKTPSEEKIKEAKKEGSISSYSEGVLALPKVRKLAEEKNVDLSNIKTGERITEEEVLNEASSKEPEAPKENNSSKEVKATPSVRKLAREKEIDLEKVEGTGRGGKITRNDVLAFEEQPREKEEDTEKYEENVGERIELNNVWKNVADKMTRSKFNAPHVTHVEKIDITELTEIREDEKDEVEAHLTYLPFIMKACIEGLKDYPRLNAELDEENMEVILKEEYNFNIAVDTERGLLIPVVENVEDKNIVELAEDIGKEVEKAKEGKVSKKEMDKGTFSITNLGVIGGDAFTPIINYPQTAILGIGQIKETAEVIDGEIKPRKTVQLSLSYDHRVVDGAMAAKFINTVKNHLENPEKLLLKL